MHGLSNKLFGIQIVCYVIVCYFSVRYVNSVLYIILYRVFEKHGKTDIGLYSFHWQFLSHQEIFLLPGNSQNYFLMDHRSLTNHFYNIGVYFPRSWTFVGLQTSKNTPKLFPRELFIC